MSTLILFIIYSVVTCLLYFYLVVFPKKNASNCCTMPTFEGCFLFHTKMTKQNSALLFSCQFPCSYSFNQINVRVLGIKIVFFFNWIKNEKLRVQPLTQFGVFTMYQERLYASPSSEYMFHSLCVAPLFVLVCSCVCLYPLGVVQQMSLQPQLQRGRSADPWTTSYPFLLFSNGPVQFVS